MAIDAYSLCPGGSGKRLKFCCKDLLGELEQLDRMQQGDQQFAALERIEQLDREKPDRACLLEIKCQLLQGMERLDDLRATAQRFVEKHPDNPVAHAEAAILAAHDQGGRAAMAELQQALELMAEGLHPRLYDAIAVVAHALLNDGQLLAARALLLMQTMLDREDQQPTEVLVQLNGTPNMPLVMKDDPVLKPAPEGAPWKAEFDEVMSLVGRLRWRQAARRLAEIAARVPDSPVVWHNLATLRGWAGDTEGAIEALHKLSGLDLPLEDASEAATLAMMMSDDPLGDHVEILTASCPIGDVDAVEAAIGASRQALGIAPDRLPNRGEDVPPPKSGFLVLDRLPLEEGREAPIDQVPRGLGQVLLFGRETDRPARLELVAVSARRLDAIRALLGEWVPELRGAAVEPEVLGRVSASRQLLRRDWYLPGGLTPEQALRMADQFLHDVLLRQWPELPLGRFNGQTARQAAADPAQRVQLMAAILLLEFWTEQSGETFDFNLLRADLGLPRLTPIDPQGIAVDHVPLVRLERVEVEKLSDEALLQTYRRALAFRVTAALGKLSLAMVERPSLAGRQELIPAYRYLAETEDDTGRAVEYIDRGRKVSQAAGDSCAPWDFMELSVRLERGEIEEFRHLIGHIQSQHIREPGVAASLHRLLVDIGAIRPDGSPAMPAAPEEPSILVPGVPGEQPGKLWTPDSQAPRGDKPKIWTPD